MSKHRTHSNHSYDRRTRFNTPPPRRGGSPTPLVMAVCVLLGFVLVYLIASGWHARATRVEITQIARTAVDVTLPVATFADGQARFYGYATGAGREIRFFVVKSPDGVLRAAFDACDICYRDKRGYHQQGNVMVCTRCGRTFRSVNINVLQGGCNPAPLERNVVGDQIVLKVASIEAGAVYF